VVRRPAGFDTDQTRRQFLEERQDIATLQLPANNYVPSRTTRASLGAGTVRYTFTVTGFHRLPLAGLPAHPSSASIPEVELDVKIALD
jgi:hypothetical protein